MTDSDAVKLVQEWQNTGRGCKQGAEWEDRLAEAVLTQHEQIEQLQGEVFELKCALIRSPAAAETMKQLPNAMRLYTERIEQLTALVRKIPSLTKHGPNGRGFEGPCDDPCLKCQAEDMIRKLAEGES